MKVNCNRRDVEMEVHEAANLFPLDEGSIPELAEDIRKNGLLVPIELLAGKVLDGRRRLRACELAGVEPQFRDVSPADPISYAWSLNGPRRHLTVAQKSMVGGRMRAMYDEQAKQRKVEGGKTAGKGRPKQVPVNSPEPVSKGDARDRAGEAVGVSGFSIDAATKVLTRAEPELVKAVDDGKIAVSRAAKLADAPPEVQIAEAAKATAPHQRTAPIEKPKPEAPAPRAPAEQKERSRVLGLAQAAIDLLRKIGGASPVRAEAFQMVRTYMKANP